MRTFKNLGQAFSESERTLWEAGIPKADIKSVKPWNLSVTDTRDWADFYEGPEGGPELRALIDKELTPAIAAFKEIYEKADGDFLDLPYLFPDSPTELEQKTILNRFLFEVNGHLNVSIYSLNCSLYRQLALNWAMSLHFAKLFAEANGLGLGHLYHSIGNLYESQELLSTKNIY